MPEAVLIELDSWLKIQAMADTVKRLDQVIRNIRGPGVINRPDGITINPPQPLVVRRGSEDDDMFWARIDDSTQDGTNKRWIYDWTEIEKTAAGYGGWTAKSDGRSGTAAAGTGAYNEIEDQNAASGTYGNGVASANLVGTFDIKPAPDATRVLMRMVTLEDGSQEAWFGYENAIDGACS